MSILVCILINAKNVIAAFQVLVIVSTLFIYGKEKYEILIPLAVDLISEPFILIINAELLSWRALRALKIDSQACKSLPFPFSEGAVGKCC